jgi:hypothetical protein
MSINQLNHDAHKSWLNPRVNNLKVDGDLIVSEINGSAYPPSALTDISSATGLGFYHKKLVGLSTTTEFKAITKSDFGLAFIQGQTGYIASDGTQLSIVPAPTPTVSGVGVVKSDGVLLTASPLIASEIPIISISNTSGTLQAAQEPAHTGDVTNSAGSLALTISPGVVTNSKLANESAMTIKGNKNASPSTPQDLTPSEVKTMLSINTSDISGLTSFVASSPVNISLATGVLQAAQEPAHTGDVTNSAGSLVLTVAPNAVTNAKLAPMSNNTFKGNASGGVSSPMDLSPTDVKNALAISIMDVGGLGDLAGQNTVSLNTQVTGILQSGNFGSLTGDVTSSGYSTAISPGVVTNTKLANMPAFTIKSNTTGVSASPSDSSISNILDLVSSSPGSLLYRGASWLALPAGSSGQILSSNGVAAPSWISYSPFVPLTGDVTTSGSVATITVNSVTNTKAAQMPTLTIKGNNTGATANAGDLTASQVKTLLAITSADVSGLGALAVLNTVSLTTQATGTLQAAQTGALTGDVTSTAGSYATIIANNAVTNAKSAQMAANTLKGNNTGATANAGDLTAAQVKTLLAVTFSDISGVSTAAQEPAHTGDVTNSAGSLALTIANNAVTNTKSAQMPANTIKSNLTAGVADPVDNTYFTVKEALLNSMTTTPGSMLYRGASNWGGIAPGTVGQVLTMASATLPLWQNLPTTTPFSSLTNANNPNTLDNGAHIQTWNWSTGNGANLLSLVATSLTAGSLLTLQPGSNGIGLTCNGRINSVMGPITNTTAQSLSASINDFMELKVSNISATANAQSGFTAESNTGSPTSGFAWMGINNSAFNNPQTYNAGVAGDVTFVGSGQDLILANASQSKAIKFQTGKNSTPFFDDRMTILNSGLVGINTITPVNTLDVVGSIGLNSRIDNAAAVTVLVTDHLISLNSATTQAITLLPAASYPRTIIKLINRAGVVKTTSPAYVNAAGTAVSTIPGYTTLTLQCIGNFYQQVHSSKAQPPAFRATLASAQSIPPNTNTVMSYNTVLYDTYGNNLTGSLFTCPLAGIYNFSGAVQLNGTLNGTAFIEIINSNGQASYAPIAPSASGVCGGNISTDMQMAIGETMSLRIRHSNILSVSTTANANYNYFTGRFVG